MGAELGDELLVVAASLPLKQRVVPAEPFSKCSNNGHRGYDSAANIGRGFAGALASFHYRS